MKRIYRRVKQFIRHGRMHRKALYITALAAVLIFGFSLVFTLPKADHTSVQAGLTIVAEILGVLLGALLLIVERLIDQGQQAAQLLRTAHPEYYELVESHLSQIDAAREKLIQLVESGKINLDDPIFVDSKGVPLKTKYRDVVGNLTALALAMDSLGYEDVEKTLDGLGFGGKQRDEFLIGKGLLADYDCAKFLKIVEDALDVITLAQWCSNEVSDLASEVLRRYMQDGIDRALSRLERSRSVLRSKSLAAGIFLLTTTTLAAVMGLFGATEHTVGTPTYTGIIVLVAAGFLLSILVILVLIEKIFIRL